MFKHRLRIVRRRRVRRSASKKSIAHFLLYKEPARALVTSRVEHFKAIYNFKIGKIAIRNQISRWGSCSSKGNLNFNYKIVLLPAHLADYIVVHELCHLKEFNHSQKFWDLVTVGDPEYKRHRAELRKIPHLCLTPPHP